MSTVAGILVGLVAIIHVVILVLEMFFWATPGVRAAFGTTGNFAQERSRWWPTRVCTKVSW